jgi:hypothetical protein
MEDGKKKAIEALTTIKLLEYSHDRSIRAGAMRKREHTPSRQAVRSSSTVTATK